MEKLLIRGGNRLSGEVTISGAKNAAVAILPACILVKDVCKIENLPDIKDVKLYLRILKELGAEVNIIDRNTVEIDCTNVNSFEPSRELTRRMRGSSYLMGALLGRFARFKVDPPGGCDFGTRPIDQHIKSFEVLGAEVDTSRGFVNAKADAIRGGHIFFDVVSVGATVNAMLAAVCADGLTIIENAAKEPHVVDLANFLNAMGANVRGAGTDTIRIRGAKELHGGTYAIIPDQIEAGTFMIAAAATRGDVTIKNVIPRHLEVISAKLIEAGVNVEDGFDSVRVWVDEGKKFKRINFIALPYPGFPTDMQPQLVAFLTTIEGTSTAREGVWDNRFRYVNELKRMGANIRVEGKLAIVDGVDHL
ncbi:MAG: UDP-N-acetylglucosamine 1-carboxyvinyltransferase, partial [Clostridia bacterium]|nr:UDP-N-acetylglucosamine 1-carboxyvinyltransferase [Clostridia bacterium]